MCFFSAEYQNIGHGVDAIEEEKCGMLGGLVSGSPKILSVKDSIDHPKLEEVVMRREK